MQGGSIFKDCRNYVEVAPKMDRENFEVIYIKLSNRDVSGEHFCQKNNFQCREPILVVFSKF